MAITVQTHRFAQLLKLKVIEFDDYTLAPQPDLVFPRQSGRQHS
jgi:hypothetical protein